ncbi:MAG: hypothetical protein GDA50_06035 [Alphaproteobacteria bacterium GM202ARS2]|nr:hypothetical protein [Alphaproteobacteria bacterium GM202ARS2]
MPTRVCNDGGGGNGIGGGFGVGGVGGVGDGADDESDEDSNGEVCVAVFAGASGREAKHALSVALKRTNRTKIRA